MPRALRRILRRVLPKRTDDTLRLVRRQDIPKLLEFIRGKHLNASLSDRLRIVRQVYRISSCVHCPHTEAEILSYISTIISLPETTPGVVVEAGCFKGGSTAKFSLASDLADRDLVVFDSFSGIPANSEPHDKTIFGEPAKFSAGSYAGSLDEVKCNVAKYGKIERCRFIKGWFDDTMPHFREPIAAAYIDVDLASSTQTCLKYLYPLLQPGGLMYSQDGHLPLVIDVLSDDQFWEHEVGCKKPRMIGLGTSKLVTVIKDPDGSQAESQQRLAERSLRP